jgi:hypothetical protein
MNRNHSTASGPRLAEHGKLLLYWTLVGIPLGWGTWQVLVKSLALFA